MGSDGGVVELLADEDRPGGWLLLLDRVRQSYVATDDPTYLEFPYLQVLAEVIEALPTGPLDVVHVGGGAATLARWLAAVRPGSAQLVFENHAELLRLISHRLPVDPSSGIEFRLGDGRSGLVGLPPSTADVVVIDAFSGGRVPAGLGTVEFLAEVARVVRPSGMLLMNVTAAAGSIYLRRLVAAVATCFPDLMLCGEQDGVVGNLVIAAARPGCLPPAPVPATTGPLGVPLHLSGDALATFVGSAEPLSDADPMRSPVPPDETWRVGGLD